MLKSLLLTALGTAVAIGAGYADQAKSPVVIPVPQTAPTSGKQMYVNYCAPCHGVDARGHGPVAAELKRPPIDLTVLSRNNGGTFPGKHITSVLEYGSEIPSHGTAQMPVWGPIFGRMDTSLPGEKMLRISNLSHFLESIQVK
jgi:mono/diheme cytochrome c family protein